MISTLRGKLLEVNPPQLLLEVAGGIGFELQVPQSAWSLQTGMEVKLFTHLHIREDSRLLYGFTTDEERSVFRLIIRVKGIGPKIALAALSGTSAAELLRAIAAEDISALTSLPKIGERTARRAIMEMRDTAEFKSLIASGHFVDTGSAGGGPTGQSFQQEALSALESLGFSARESSQAVRQVLADTEVDSSQGLIRLALAKLKSV